MPPVNNQLTPSAFLSRLRGLSRQRHYALAVSGGADSIALLGLAIGAAKLKGAPKFSVLTVDHGLRVAARAETQMVAKWARDHGLAAHVLRYRGEKPTSAVQNWARNMRYDLMSDFCEKHKISTLVTAHHMGDQAETFLMRLARGSGLRGLSAMQLVSQRKNILILRPMLSQLPESLRDLCASKKWHFIEDPSNSDRAYERVRIRNLWPQLNEIGLTPEMIARSAEKLSLVASDMDAQLDELIECHGMFNPLGFVEISRDIFEGLTETMQSGLLSRCLSHISGVDYPPSVQSLEHMRLQALSGLVAAMTLKGVQMRSRKNHILLGRETKKAANMDDLACEDAGDYVWDGRFAIHFNQGAKGRRIRALGPYGLGEMRDRMSQREMPQKRDVPSGYLAALPAIYKGEKLVGCPSLIAIKGISVSIVN